MDKSILKPEIQQFITANSSVDITKLALLKNPFPEVNWLNILNQITAKAKCKTKLPHWYNTENIIYPNKISIEQTSSETTAKYKSSLVSGGNLIDLTGGFGVDDYYFSKRVNNVVHCEINLELSSIVKHNFEILNIQNVTCLPKDSYEVLQSLNQQFDWIYIDPSRRSDAKGKVFMLKDCLPNVVALLDFYFTFSENILIKTAPILDITAGLSELKNVKNIHVVAVDGEVKELLWEIQKDFKKEISIKTINLLKQKNEIFDFVLNQNKNEINYDLPQKYLFEPNAAIMKSGGFNEVSSFFNLKKLHAHSHLYTSNITIAFPGRTFLIENSFSYNKASMKLFLENKKINITSRNFPDSVESIRKKWKIKDGGDQYCFFTTDINNNKIVLICTKIQS